MREPEANTSDAVPKRTPSEYSHDDRPESNAAASYPGISDANASHAHEAVSDTQGTRTAPVPTPESEDEEPDVRETISVQVSAVMDEKKRRKHRFIRRSPLRKAQSDMLKPIDGHVSAESTTGDGIHRTSKTGIPRILALIHDFFMESPESEETDFSYSDDLRSFRRLSPADAMRKAKRALSYYKWRCIATFILALMAGYISVAPTYRLPLPSFISYVRKPFTYLFLLSAIQICAMFLSVSFLADGLRMLSKKRFKAEFLIFFACVINLFYTMWIMLVPESGGYLPYHTVVTMMLFFGMLARCLRYNWVIHACQALTSSSGKYAAINGIRSQNGTVQTIYKQEPKELNGQIPDHFWEEDRVERLMQRYVPFALAVTLIFALIAAFGGSGRVNFLWCWSALLALSLPGGLLTAYVMPMSFVSGRLAGVGSFLNGHRATLALDEADSVVVLERDLFPTRTLTISSVNVYADFTPEKVNLCTLAVLKASGSGLYDALASSLPRVPLNMPAMESFEFYDNGGMGAYVNSDRVLIGSYAFLVHSSVKMPENIENTTGVYVAINMQLAGFYHIRYTAQSPVRRALACLIRRKLHPILALRDFNLTQRVVEVRFRLPRGSAEYPDLPNRVALSGSRSGLDDEPLGAIARNSAFFYADAVVSGKRIHFASCANLALGIISAALGTALNFFLLFSRESVAITPINELYFSILWFLPSLLISIGANRR